MTSRYAMQPNLKAAENIPANYPVCVNYNGDVIKYTPAHEFIGVTTLAASAGGAVSLAPLTAGWAIPISIDEDIHFDASIITKNRIASKSYKDGYGDTKYKINISFADFCPSSVLPFIPIQYDAFTRLALCIFAPW